MAQTTPQPQGIGKADKWFIFGSIGALIAVCLCLLTVGALFSGSKSAKPEMQAAANSATETRTPKLSVTVRPTDTPRLTNTPWPTVTPIPSLIVPSYSPSDPRASLNAIAEAVAAYYGASEVYTEFNQLKTGRWEAYGEFSLPGNVPSRTKMQKFAFDYTRETYRSGAPIGHVGSRIEYPQSTTKPKCAANTGMGYDKARTFDWDKSTIEAWVKFLITNTDFRDGGPGSIASDKDPEKKYFTSWSGPTAECGQ